jgi:hypothetical protein
MTFQCMFATEVDARRWANQAVPRSLYGMPTTTMNPEAYALGKCQTETEIHRFGTE